MNQKTSGQYLLAFGISLVLVACQPGTRKTEAQPMDTASSMQSEAPKTQATAAAMDPAKVAPTLYRVLADSAGIRILKVNYGPGASSGMHAHPLNALYVVRGATVTFTLEDGSKRMSELKTGMAAVRAAEMHSAQNTGKTPLQAVLVEVNRPTGGAPMDAKMDAAKVAPNLYKVKSDSAGIRVLEITYKPGQSSAMHAHPDGALYVIEGGRSEFTQKDGSKQTLELKPGTAMVMPAGEHSVKNVGKTTTRALLVEVYRPKP